jgi:hypothetical protein
VRRRPPLAPASLTSLVDVLFILVFAALVQRAGATSPADVSAPALTPPAEPARPQWSPPAESERLRQAAISHLTEQLQQQPAVIARVSQRGVLTSIEVSTRGAAVSTSDAALPAGQPVSLELALIERVDDPDVAVGYIGERDRSRRICALIAARMGPSAWLRRVLVVIAVDAPLAELMVALVTGLRRDVEACLAEQGAAAVLLDSLSLSAVVPESSKGTP